ncbi:hypothetical protein D3C77_720990 [compost metagenome]
MAARATRKTTVATVSATSRLRMEMPNRVVSVKNAMMRSFMSTSPLVDLPRCFLGTSKRRNRSIGFHHAGQTESVSVDFLQ